VTAPPVEGWQHCAEAPRASKGGRVGLRTEGGQTVELLSLLPWSLSSSIWSYTESNRLRNIAQLARIRATAACRSRPP
jgi:hypothetical protein